MPQKRIIDKRKKEKYMVDDEYLNGMARLCGWKGTIVYNSLCRHANKDQECFPSIQKMADQHGVNRKTIIKGLENLEKRKVIETGKKRTKSGQWLNNTYTLLDKSEWDYSQVPHKDMDTQVPHKDNPCPSQGPDHVLHKDTKETHSEGNTLKETHNIAKQSFADSDTECTQNGFKGLDVNEILNLFYEINPGLEFGNKTQRKAIEALLNKVGKDRTINTVKYAISIQGEKYAPVITTPVQLKNKLGDLKVYYDKNNKSSLIVDL